jgi:hypothetical protein
LRPLRGASERWRRAARATVGRLVLFGERFGESDAKICATHRANCELSLTTPSLRMVKSAGSNTIAFTKSSTARSTFGRSGRTQPSTSAHADFAAVNVNFWITPDEANLDSKTGGMIVYDLEVPPIGASNATIHKRTKSALCSKKRNAAATYTPYKPNRAIIFNSDLFHTTAAIYFREGYENRRINVTMLFGRREADARHHE